MRRLHDVWYEDNCTWNSHIIGKKAYFLSADGFLMPTRKDQAVPDLKYFNILRK